MTHNPKRAPYTAQTKAKVRELREEGYSNVQITEATGVPASTIARWAAEGGWRVSDLVNAQVSLSPEAKSPCACVVSCMAPRSEGCRMNPPVEMETPPLGLLPGLGGESWGKLPSPFEGEGVGVRDTMRPQAGLSEKVSTTPLIPNPSPNQGEKGSSQKARQARLEEALTNAARAAEDAIMQGNFVAAAKATQMADTLSRSLERVRVPEEEEQPDGVFYSFEQIADARAELLRRLDRIAATIRPDEMVNSGFD
ncbi:hypothetical protein [Ponticaulis koreensis]|uniref:hypothetical protein n=1 Tax=Ponticaulis koreensis TaxID=1123045 RepID=UPI0012DC7D6A|nr:hypothetical protein [Ponticaulis koreensis]